MDKLKEQKANEEHTELPQELSAQTREIMQNTSPHKRVTKKYPACTPFGGMEYETSESSEETQSECSSDDDFFNQAREENEGTFKSKRPISSILMEDTEEQKTIKAQKVLEAPVRKQKSTKKFMTLTSNKMVAIQLINNAVTAQKDSMVERVRKRRLELAKKKKQ